MFLSSAIEEYDMRMHVSQKHRHEATLKEYLNQTYGCRQNDKYALTCYNEQIDARISLGFLHNLGPLELCLPVSPIFRVRHLYSEVQLCLKCLQDPRKHKTR